MAADAEMTAVDSLIGCLVVESGAAEGQEFRLRGTVRIGRMEDNDIVLADPKVSRYHAIIAQGEAGYSLVDLNSTNGTFLNGERIAEPRVLREEANILLGNTLLVFRWVPISEAAPAPSAYAPPKAAPPVLVSARTQVPAALLTKKRSSRRPVVLVVLGVGLLILICVIAAVAIYFLLGKPDVGIRLPDTNKAPVSVVTLVVTGAPEATATAISQPITAAALCWRR